MRVRLRVVLRDDDRVLVQDLVEVAVRRQDLLQRLLDRDAVETDRHRRVREVLPIELHADAAHLAERRQDVAKAGVVERDAQRIAVRRIEQRLLALRARLLPQRVNRRLRTALLDAIADYPLELRGPRLGQPVRRVHLDRLLVLDQSAVQLVLQFEVMCAADVFPRRALHRPLERDLERGVVRVLLDRLGEVRHRSVPVARTGGLLALTVRTPGGAARAQRCQRRKNDENNQPVLQRRYSIQRGRPRGLRSDRHSST